MNMDDLRHFFAWSTVINYIVILIWLGVYLLVGGPLSRLCEMWFALPPEKFKQANFKGLMVYKIGLLIFSLTPYLALRIIR